MRVYTDGDGLGTLKVGFPTAEILPVSGRSLEEIIALEEKNPNPVAVAHDDLMFWRSMEDIWFQPPVLVAHRSVSTIGEARLQSGLLWIQNPYKLAKELEGRSFSTLGTATTAYFSPEVLDRYDHFFVEEAEGTLPQQAKRFLLETYETAKKDPLAIKGIWREQEAMMRAGTVPEARMYERWCLGDKDAIYFLTQLFMLSQIADDLVDEKLLQLERSQKMTDLMIGLLVGIGESTFYLKHKAVLLPVIHSSMQMWDGSNRWAASASKRTRLYGYVHRDITQQVFGMVAYILGGSSWARQVTQEVNEQYHAISNDTFDDWEQEQLARRRGEVPRG